MHEMIESTIQKLKLKLLDYVVALASYVAKTRSAVAFKLPGEIYINMSLLKLLGG